MKILNLTREAAELQFHIEELAIFEKLLMEAHKQLRDVDFKERIRGISRDETLRLLSVIREIINSSRKRSVVISKNKFIQSIDLNGEQILFELTYKSLLGLRSILNELCYGICTTQNFYERIGVDKSSVSSLLDVIHFDLVEKMEEDMPETLIFKKSREIRNDLKLKPGNLEADLTSLEIRKECFLNLESSRTLSFSLSSLSSRKVFSGIQVVDNQLPRHPHLKVHSSGIQAIRNTDLIRLVAHLELALTSEISTTDLKNFTLEVYNSRRSFLFNVQIFPEENESEVDSFNLFFRFYPETFRGKKGGNKYLVSGVSNANDIYLFTSSVRDFLSRLPDADSVE